MRSRICARRGLAVLAQDDITALDVRPTGAQCHRVHTKGRLSVLLHTSA